MGEWWACSPRCGIACPVDQLRFWRREHGHPSHELRSCVIRAAAWYSGEHYGVFAPSGRSWQKPSPPSSATADMLSIIDRQVKYFGRLTTESRFGLCAASIALREAHGQPSDGREIGIISSSSDASLRDNQEYFRDYVDAGRSLGRGNLFIYTLPTSVAGEIAIALLLTGPCMFVHAEKLPLMSLIRNGERIVADGEAEGMICLWSEPDAALAFAIDSGEGDDSILALLDSQSNPAKLIHCLQAMVRQT
jgi:hypothetical protein